jgi:hypothetical protein
VPEISDAEKRVIVHHVAGSSFPHWLGTDQVRHDGFSDDGNTLTLSVKSGDRVTRVLTWKRVR